MCHKSSSHTLWAHCSSSGSLCDGTLGQRDPRIMGRLPYNPILYLRLGREELREHRGSGGGSFSQRPQGTVASRVPGHTQHPQCTSAQSSSWHPGPFPEGKLIQRVQRDRWQKEPAIEKRSQTHTHRRAGRDLHWWPFRSWWGLHRWPSRQPRRGTPALHTWRPHWKCLKEKREPESCGLGSQAHPGTGTSTFLTPGPGISRPLQDMWHSFLSGFRLSELSDVLTPKPYQSPPKIHSLRIHQNVIFSTIRQGTKHYNPTSFYSLKECHVWLMSSSISKANKKHNASTATIKFLSFFFFF